MSVHLSPTPLPRRRSHRGCLGALGYAILGALACFIVGIVLNYPHSDRVRQWHPYGAGGPAVSVFHRWTWAWALNFGILNGAGYNRYEIVAGEDPSGTYGAPIAMPGYVSPGDGELAKIRVTGDARGITITFSGGEHFFIPKANLKGR